MGCVYIVLTPEAYWYAPVNITGHAPMTSTPCHPHNWLEGQFSPWGSFLIGQITGFHQLALLPPYKWSPQYHNSSTHCQSTWKKTTKSKARAIGLLLLWTLTWPSSFNRVLVISYCWPNSISEPLRLQKNFLKNCFKSNSKIVFLFKLFF